MAIDKTTTPIAHPPEVTGRGSKMRCTASQPMKTLEASTMPACTREARPSALPWP